MAVATLLATFSLRSGWQLRAMRLSAELASSRMASQSQHQRFVDEFED